jgi:uncharacterized integral membrane protein (TIGR00698 family)
VATGTRSLVAERMVPDFRDRGRHRLEWLLRHWPGLLLVVVLSVAAQFVAAAQELLLGRAWIEGLVLALLLGVAAGNSGLLGRQFDAGAAYAGKQVLEFAVVLLGAGVNASVLSTTGPSLAAIVVAGVVLALVAGFWIGRLLGLGSRLALLVATGNAICGNSAIAAMAPVIRAEKGEVAAAVALTAVVGVGLVLALPLLIPLLSLTDHQYGVLAGMAVYAVPQVLAAALPVSPLSVEIATTVKLGRVLLLGPVVMSVGLIVTLLGARGGSRPKLRAFLPWFVVGFALLAALRVADILPDAVAPAHLAAG